MKKNIVLSYVAGISDVDHSESYQQIIRYFIPEYIAALVLYSVLYLFDAYLVADLKSTAMYATLGVTNTLVHFIVKVAEGLSVSTIVLVGRANGAGNHKAVGRIMRDSFWITVIIGTFIAGVLYSRADLIYRWYGVPEEMIALGIPFLRLRAVGIFFTFIYFALISFLRGIKNTRAPMIMYMIGAVFFVAIDWVLIKGKCGFAPQGLQGSAWASVIQYGVMFICCLIYVLRSSEHKKYKISLFGAIQDGAYMKQLLYMSLPVVIDKATLAGAYLWLGKVIAPMGTYALATFVVLRDLERVAILPAVACAQVATFMVSNDMATGNWLGIKANIKKIILVASILVMSTLIFFTTYAEHVIRFFDRNGDFTPLAARVIPFLSILILCDLLQLILSGGLRGAAQVHKVMMTRLIVCLCYFVPVSYFFSQIPFSDTGIKFIIVYGSFFIGNLLMSIAYTTYFRGTSWQKNDHS